MPRIYVACLASYNAGTLHGEWIEAAQDATELQDAISAMLAKSPEPGAEEWAIHDFEGFGGYRLGEWESMENVALLAEKIEEHGDAFPAFLDAFGMDPKEGAERFEEAYMGEWDSLQAYAENYVEDVGLLDGVPETVARYFDFEAFARDLAHDVTTADADGGVYVFNSNF